MHDHDKMGDFMKLALVLLILALLVPMAFSSPASDGETHFTKEAIDASHTSIVPAPDPVFKASEKVFVGSIKSNKYHYPSCRWAKKIKPENEIWFTGSADARAHGYVPCSVCNPP